MARGKTVRAEAVIKMNVNGHALHAEKWSGKWVFHCPSFPEISEAHGGCADASQAIEDFVRRATGHNTTDAGAN